MLLLCTALLVGFLVLFWSADQFVNGSVATARNLNISPMLIGLTVVSVGTSAPEIFVSVTSALDGAPELAVGNALGSNIANIGLVLGITAMLVPLPFRIDVLRRDLPILILVTLCAGFTLHDGYMGRLDGLVLLLGLVGFLARLFVEHRRSSAMEIAAEIPELGEIPDLDLKRSLGLLALSLILLLLAAETLVWSATGIAESLGVSSLIIGLTVIAVGTSLPELVVAIASATKGETDLAIGNIVGSNIFNILAVLTIPCLLAPTDLSGEVLLRDYLLMALMTGLLVIFAYGVTRRPSISRTEGVVLFGIWAAYLGFIYLTSANAA